MSYSPLKWSIESIQNYLDENYKGFKILSNNYRTMQDRVDISCPFEHVHNLVWRAFLSNKSKCQTCAKIQAEVDKLQTTKERVEALGEGYILIEMTDSTRAKIMCNNNHIYNVHLSNLQKGARCQVCTLKELANKNRLSIDYVRDHIESVGYKLLSNEYETNETMLTVECDNKHVYKVKYTNFQAGRRCGKCVGGIPYTQEEVAEYLESIGYKLLSDYDKADKDITIECYKKHIIEMRLSNILWGSRCRICYFGNARGLNHPAWKGSQTVNLFLRAQTIDWKKESLEAAKYKCDISGEGGELHIHHKYPFYMIVDDLLEKLNLSRKESMEEYSQNEILSMIDNVKRKHTELLGVVLRPDIHKFYHHLFGFNNTEEQYDFFKENYEALKNGFLTAQDFYGKAS